MRKRRWFQNGYYCRPWSFEEHPWRVMLSAAIEGIVMWLVVLAIIALMAGLYGLPNYYSGVLR